jgi:hypothetical protein
MADDRERQAVDQDLEVDEERSEEITGGAAQVEAVESLAQAQSAASAAKRQPITLPNVAQP